MTNFGESKGGERGLWRRLNDRCTPSCEGSGELASDHGRREIPWRRIELYNTRVGLFTRSEKRSTYTTPVRSRQQDAKSLGDGRYR